MNKTPKKDGTEGKLIIFVVLTIFLLAGLMVLFQPFLLGLVK